MTTADENHTSSPINDHLLNNSDLSNDTNSCTTNTTLSDDLAEKLHVEDEAKLFVNGTMTSLNSNHKYDQKNKPQVAKAKFDKTKLQPTKNGPKLKETTTPVSSDNRGYKNAKSPSGNSEGSADSGDSGRATGGPNCSPFDNQHSEYEPMPVYEFEVPNTLVGLIIGVQGKTISELCTRANVRMLIRPHYNPARFESHQICSIEGKRKNVNKSLHMIRYRFPQNRFPDLNLQPVFPPNVLDPQTAMPGAEPTTLSLPIGVPCEVFVCAVVDAGHFFVQLPTHPTFSSLETLDLYTMNIYSRLSSIPVLPKPCSPGIVCVAPTANGWFRAITLHYSEEDDSVIVRLADYGGFLRLKREELRQIRSDLTSLPMQAIECYLAHVEPADGTAYWSQEAIDMFSKLCASRIVQAEIKGYNKDTNIPYVELYAIDEHKKVKRVDTMLVEMGHAKLSDPTKMIPVTIAPQTHVKNAPNHHHHNSNGKFVGKPTTIRR
ncbi:A-kinase anchor protein 1, mitochondrial [Aphelenchoides bicaudatus]|nr:A-kinase anchor protein 1, mitochondrial [Aphelenchoides bicaudatus]